MAYFPAFMKTQGCPVLIVGGDKSAFRKIEVLLDFGADITVIAPEFIDEIQNLYSKTNRDKDKKHSKIKLIPKDFEEADLNGMGIVIAATDDKELNHKIAELCKEKGIPVNAVDQIEDCTFIFPSYIKQGDVVAAFSSGGKSPVVTQYLREKVTPFLTEELAELTECLGNLRTIAKQTIPTEKERKAFFEEILQLGIAKGGIPSETEIALLISSVLQK